jgi:glycosyltransferase involved in cell wall biosynthesis
MHIVSFSAVTWDFPLVGRTRMLTEAWLDVAQPTTFVQVPSLRTLGQRLTRAGTGDDPPAMNGSPIVVRPFPGPPARLWPMLGHQGVRRAVRAPARALARRLGRHIDWSSAIGLVVSPIWTPWLEHLPLSRLIYDCIDDPDVHAPRPRLVPMIRRWERELMQRADGVVVTARGLEAHCRAMHADVPISLVRNGVDPEAFRRAADRNERPADLPPPGRPIVGFVGALYDWIDWPLIDNVVRAMPDHEFVFVGPHAGEPAQSRIASLANAHFLGQRPYASVPAYMKSFDVAWVPFDTSQVSALANPIKIYEYLALGRPVVTTPVADVEHLGGTCRVASGAKDVVNAILAAQHDNTPALESDRSAFADRQSWRQRASDIVEFCESLSEPATARR